MANIYDSMQQTNSLHWMRIPIMVKGKDDDTHHSKPQSNDNDDNNSSINIVSSSLNNKIDDDDKAKKSPYIVNVTIIFLLRYTITSLIISFLVGCTARSILMKRTTTTMTQIMPSQQSNNNSEHYLLPSPVFRKGHQIPHTKYTSKKFDTAATTTSITSHSLFLIPTSTNDQRRQTTTTTTTTTTSDRRQHSFDSCKHYLVDLRHVSRSFLIDDYRLAKALLLLVEESWDLNLLSYHCYSSESDTRAAVGVFGGVSCFGVLWERGHVIVHTDGRRGLLSLDALLCNSNGFSVDDEREQWGRGKVANDVIRLFGVKEKGDVNAVESSWVMKLRGRREETWQDLDRFVAQREWVVGMKQEVASFRSKIGQRMDIYDISPHGESSNSRNHLLFIDGVLTSSTEFSAIQHESFVHPGVFAHKFPLRAAIVGHGGSGSLKEVIKHESIEKIEMVGVDRDLIEKLRRYFPDWDDCSNIVNSSNSCLEDVLVDVHLGDAVEWFEERFGEGMMEGKMEKFDVILMDTFDPIKNVGIPDSTSSPSYPFWQSTINALIPDGILILKLGKPPLSNNPTSQQATFISQFAQIYHMMDHTLQMKKFHFYEEPRANTRGGALYLIACRSETCNINWYAHASEIEYFMHERTYRMHNPDVNPLFRHFDGATMKNYAIPHKLYERVYCQSRDPPPDDCLLLLRDAGAGAAGAGAVGSNLSSKLSADTTTTAAFEVRKSSLGEQAGWGVFATVDVPKGSVIGREAAHLAVHFPAVTHEILYFLFNEFQGKESRDLRPVYYYMFGYGFEGESLGGSDAYSSSTKRKEYYVDASIYTFVNHGCNQTSNIGLIKEVVCLNTPGCDLLSESVDDVQTLQLQNVPYWNSLVYYRNRAKFHTGFDIALRDIKAGEELFHNYLYFEHSQQDLIFTAKHLKKLCNGEDIGDISIFSSNANLDDWEDDSEDD